MIIKLGLGQQDSIQSEAGFGVQTSYTWKGSCCDNFGKPLNPSDIINQFYNVKKFNPKIQVDINLKSIKIGSKTISLNVNYKDKIEGDTKIVTLNDTVGIKLTIAKTVENGTKKYLYKLQVYKKDIESNCWRALTNSMSFFDVYSQTMSLNLFSIGYPDTKDYFQIVDGWIKFD